MASLPVAKIYLEKTIHLQISAIVKGDNELQNVALKMTNSNTITVAVRAISLRASRVCFTKAFSGTSRKEHGYQQ